MKLRPTSSASLSVVLIILFAGMNAWPQSQAIDGQIEGFIYDQNGDAISGAKVSATNSSTGFVRNLVTDQIGFYRMPLMPLGTYRVVVEAPNYMRAVRDGVTLVTGQAATIDFFLTAGGMVETVTVTGDGPVVDAGKTDLGRVMSSMETANLPLVSLNPHNFVLQQANVNGRPSRGFNFPSISANGYLRRVNYLLDGNTSTQADRAGVRLVQISGIFVKEVQLISNAFAPEFGNTPGIIMNVVTPSGTNEIDGTVSYLFRRPSFYSRPFNYTSTEDLPDNQANNFAATVGLPFIKDRWHFFGGYEYYMRDDSALPNRILTISEVDKDRLIDAGLPASIFPPSIPTREHGHFVLVRSDLQVSSNHRLALRLNDSFTAVENNIQGTMASGVTNTLERSADVTSAEHGFAAQLVSYSTSLVNELRFQFIRRKVGNVANEYSGSGPSIVISGLVNFGSPENVGSIEVEQPTQVQNNVTLISGAHVGKFGGGFTHIKNFNRENVFARYTFQSVSDYENARKGIDPFSYRVYDESSGDTDSSFRSVYWNVFAQDDWKLTPRVKLTFGLRYDLYNVPDADPTSAFPASRKFSVDKDNIAPRFAAVFALRDGKHPTVLRIGGGLYFEPPWLDMYERAIRKNGDPTYYSFSMSPTSPSAPSFPTTFPQHFELPIQDIDTVASDIENLYAIHSNAQLEHAINNDVSVAVGFIHSEGRQIAVYRSINYIPISYLPDGRPVFSRDVNIATRYDPRFNNILMAESAGRSQYNALTVQFNVRSWKNLQFFASYTLSKASDDAPEQNVALGNPSNTVLSNPFDQRFERGRSYADQRHTFVTSIVARPTFEIDNNLLRRILNNNQLGVISYVNSGQAFNIISSMDLNRDGLRQDRPLGIARNSGTTPMLFNLDLRYSRFIPLGERYRLEMFAEFTNIFNINRIVQYNNTAVVTDSNGYLIGGIPDFRGRNQSTSQESRQTQLGIKFVF